MIKRNLLILQTILLYISMHGQQLFQSSIKNAEKIIPKDFATPNDDTVTLLILGSLIIYAVTYIIYNRRFLQIFKSFISQRFVNQLTRDGNLLKETISYILYLNYFITLSLLIYLANKHILNLEILSNKPTIIQLLKISLVLVVLFLFKSIALRISGIIFKSKKETHNYLLIQYIFNQSAGIILIPLLITIVFMRINSIIYVATMLLFLLLIYRLLRLIFYRIRPLNFSAIHFFIYLCTFEILPFLILVKLIYSYLT